MLALFAPILPRPLIVKSNNQLDTAWTPSKECPRFPGSGDFSASGGALLEIQTPRAEK
jgi:hypothetical protein